MKKLFYVFTILILFLAVISVPIISSAATLDTISVEISKEKIAPDEEVSVTVNFGKELGAYTIYTAYDNAIFEYVSVDGGTATDDGEKVILTFYDSTGGSNPRTNAVITFKAKAGLTGTNPTDFSITLEGMANSDASERYDDITNAIIKDILVEPNYVDYSLTLEYTGTITKAEQKDMTLITASTLGRNYDHVRLIAEVTAKPSDDATAKILATQDDGTEVDLIQSGWGEADGYAIGGENVKQELALRGEFDADGKYTIHIKLIDRDDSDAVIVEKSFDITVGETTTETEKNTEDDEEELPTTYPQTGITQYAIVAIAIFILVAIYRAVTKNDKSKY